MRLRHAPLIRNRPSRAALVCSALLGLIPSSTASAQEVTDEEAERLARQWRRQGVAALPSLTTALCSPSSDHFVQDRAEQRLAELGPPAVSPLLTIAVEDRCRSSADLVGWVLPRVLCSTPPGTTAKGGDGRARAALRPLLGALRSKDTVRALTALDVVRRTSAYEPCAPWPLIAKRAAAPAIQLLARVGREHQGEVMLALTSLGPAAAPALPHLLPLLDDAALREQAAILLGHIGAASEPAVPRLRTLLDTPSRSVAVEALGKIGGAARSTLPELLAFLPQHERAGCKTSGVPPHLLIEAITSLSEGDAGKPFRPAAVRGLSIARAACPKLESWIAKALIRLAR